MSKKCFLMAQIIAASCMICACGAGPDETEKASNTEFVSKGYTVESDTMVTESTENTEKTTFSNAALGDVKEQTVKISKTSVIYSKPDVNASQLGSIEKGTKVKALGDVDTNGFLLSYIRELLNTADKSEISASKYCLARSICMGYQF